MVSTTQEMCLAHMSSHRKEDGGTFQMPPYKEVFDDQMILHVPP